MNLEVDGKNLFTNSEIPVCNKIARIVHYLYLEERCGHGYEDSWERRVWQCLRGWDTRHILSL